MGFEGCIKDTRHGSVSILRVFGCLCYTAKCITHSYLLQQCRTLDKTISNLETELAAARAVQDSLLSGSPISEDLKIPELTKKRKYLMVVGINTAFSSRKRRDSVRATWMLQGAPSFFRILSYFRL